MFDPVFVNANSLQGVYHSIRLVRAEMNGAAGTKRSPAGDKALGVRLRAGADRETGLSIFGLSEPIGFSK